MVYIKKTIPNFVLLVYFKLKLYLMKCFCRTLVISGLLLIIFSVVPKFSNAQFGDPGDDPDAPIDGGVGLLVAAGVGYGIKKVKENRKKNKTVQFAEETK